MNFYRVEFAYSNGKESFEIVQCNAAIEAAFIIKSKHFRCTILKVTRV